MNALVLSMLKNSVEELAPKPPEPEIDVNALARAYIKMRDVRHALKKEWEAKDKEIEDKQERIEAAMLAFLERHKINSAPTEAGTFYRQEELTPTGADWEAFYRWVAENNAFDFLERRIKKTSVKNYMEENAGAIPPGVSVYRKYVVTVRRK